MRTMAFGERGPWDTQESNARLVMDKFIDLKRTHSSTPPTLTPIATLSGYSVTLTKASS